MPSFIENVRKNIKYWIRPRDFYMQVALLMSRDASKLYELLGDDVIDTGDEGFKDPNKPLWLNFGHWQNATTYPQACEALARRLAEAAKLGPGDTVLDCGFGYAEQDVFWVKDFNVDKIIGLNITPLHVEVAQKRMQQLGFADRIDLRLGSATAVPLEDASVTKVLALESAFHFDTRDQFFAEAFRVLKPGGRLATADMLPMPGEADPSLYNRTVWKLWAIPPANVYDRNVYAQKLSDIGFINVRAESIRSYVFPGIFRYREERRKGSRMSDVVIQLSDEEIAQCKGAEFWHKNGGLSDYVLVSAEKP